MNVIGKRRWWFTLSLVLILPGVISLGVWGLRYGIDFKGGQEIEIAGNTNQNSAQQLVTSDGGHDVTATTSGTDFVVRFTTVSGQNAVDVHNKISADLTAHGLREVSYQSIGQTVSHDIKKNALIAILLASIAIVIYIAFAFRNAPPPVSPWSFGVCAIIAMLHDALFVIGVFSLLGHFAGVEVDSLFVTAVLTVIGFSVHDTIVVFDRIRENLRRYNKPFDVIVNESIIETFVRSINTSLTVVITLLALYLFGGDSIKEFVLALLLGIISGTYSSIFNASPMLVVWNNHKIKKAARPEKTTKTPAKA